MGSTTRIRNRNGRFGSSKGFFSTNSTLDEGIRQFEFKTRQGMIEFAEEFAKELQQYAQTQAPWNDRTGDARGGLEAAADSEGDIIGIQLYHTVDYGIWLEVRWSGQYAVILPSIERKGPDLLDKMKRMMDGIIYYE